jgi:small subunit ribosomal protein S7
VNEDTTQSIRPGLKFNVPVEKIPKSDRLLARYHPVVDQVTKMIMKHGKKSVAQRVRSVRADVFFGLLTKLEVGC